MGKLHAGSPDLSCKRYNPGDEQIFPGDERIFLGGKTIFLGGQKPEKMAFSVYRFLIAKQNHSFNGGEGPKENPPKREQVFSNAWF